MNHLTLTCCGNWLMLYRLWSTTYLVYQNPAIPFIYEDHYHIKFLVFTQLYYVLIILHSLLFPLNYILVQLSRKTWGTNHLRIFPFASYAVLSPCHLAKFHLHCTSLITLQKIQVSTASKLSLMKFAGSWIRRSCSFLLTNVYTQVSIHTQATQKMHGVNLALQESFKG